MKTTIIYDNTAFRKDLQADWGFSALVEAKGKRILFDTGASGSILLSNLEKLAIVSKGGVGKSSVAAYLSVTFFALQMLQLNMPKPRALPSSKYVSRLQRK